MTPRPGLVRIAAGILIWMRLAVAVLTVASLSLVTTEARSEEGSIPTSLPLTSTIPQAQLPKVAGPTLAETATTAKSKVQEPAPVEESAAPKTSLSENEFRATIGRWTGIKRCIGQAKQLYPIAKGALSMLFRISAHGGVVTTKVFDTTTTAAKEVATCLERQAPQLRFPAFAGTRPISMQARLVF